MLSQNPKPLPPLKFSIHSILQSNSSIESYRPKLVTEISHDSEIDVVSVDSGNEEMPVSEFNHNSVAMDVILKNLCVNNIQKYPSKMKIPSKNLVTAPYQKPTIVKHEEENSFSDDQLSAMKPRSRTSFTADQILQLETEFDKNEYLTRIRRINIALRLNLSEKQIRIWFQNRRVKKNKTCTKPANFNLMF